MTNETIIEDLTLIPVPAWWQNPWVWVAGVLALLAVVWLWNRFKPVRVPAPIVATPPPPGPPPHLEALRRIQDLRARHPKLSEYEVAHECSAILRQFLEERFTLPVTRQTTREFLSEARRVSELNALANAQLDAFLKFCDRLKFATEAATPARTLAAIGEAEQIIRQCVAPPAASGATEVRV